MLSRNTGYSRAYGRNPYAGYDNVNNRPFLYRGPSTPDAAAADGARADGGPARMRPWPTPTTTLEEVRVINDTGGTRRRSRYSGSRGRHPRSIPAALPPAATSAPAPPSAASLDGRVLDFEWSDGAIRDSQTASTWSLLGEATAGPLQGSRLEAVVSINHFWFSWAAFRPETRIYVNDAELN